MKKYIIITLAATAMLSACSSDDVVDLKSGSPIGFSTFIDKPTRGELTTDNLKAFNVYGYRGENTIFANETVSGSYGSTWTYTNTQYWVNGSTYDFHAIAPVTNSWAWDVSDSKAKGTIKFNNGGKSGEEDLIYDYEEVTTIPTDHTVGLSFNHLLSRVKFRFINAFKKYGNATETNIQIAVSNVKITDAYQYGTIEVGKDSKNGRDADNTKSNWIVTAAGYSDTTTPATFTLYFYEAKNGSWYRGTGETKELFMIPYGTDKQYTVSFDLKVIAYHGDPEKTYTEYGYKVENLSLGKVTMLPGYSYVYETTFDEDSVKDNLLRIEFEAKAEEWDSEENTETIASSEIKTEEGTSSTGSSSNTSTDAEQN